MFERRLPLAVPICGNCNSCTSRQASGSLRVCLGEVLVDLLAEWRLRPKDGDLLCLNRFVVRGGGTCCVWYSDGAGTTMNRHRWNMFRESS